MTSNPTLSDRLNALPGVRALALLIGVAGAVALGLWVFSWSQKPNLVPLYGALGEKDAAEVIEALRGSGIEFTLDPGSGSVLVAESAVHEARLELAALGLPQGSRSGIEMMQQEQGFGVSQLVEGARYQAALETELARTIGALKPVRNARVHLALPKPTPFSARRQGASASVLVDLFPGRRLEQDQVDAIVHLVAGSIPELQPGAVTVIDGSGRLLTRNGPDSEAAWSAQQFDQQRRLEEAYVDRIVTLLQPLTGPGRVSAQVAVELDFAVTEEARESYAPEMRLRSEQVSESVNERKGTSGVPGATSNQEPSADTPATGTDNNGQASRNATRNFELDRTVSHTRQPAGRVQRVSTAVLIDHVPATAPAAAEEDEESDAAAAPSLRALTAEEIAQVEKLVREAVGFDAQRGDTVSVMNAPFAQPEPVGEIEPLPLWERPELRDWARLGVGALVVLLLVFGVLRPLLKSLGQAAEPLPRLGADAPAQQAALPAPSGDGATAALPGGASAIPDPQQDRIARARGAVAQDPGRVAQVVKSWVAAES
jgi:flagellar M-ring protein FliF